ncbi:hypothetical protein [Aquimarina muelleri]|uniref:Uncharacterized protein n=1 Tax=Aquimarina muelleri TaxID=279356 RepID=A0A918N2Y0_9FLAO|nr:hypothetical protein [Aquimarina muelleri]MCX2763007.1 hypothetical protein [Aquimarina muelleri]GGX15409.1 hypothetical protein GCM10007384_16360 [Aquimarina muelleri]
MKKKNKKRKSHTNTSDVVPISEVKKRFKHIIPRFPNNNSETNLQTKNEMFYGFKEFIEDYKLAISFIGLTLILIFLALVSK